jgi:hypothetical protein
MNGLSKLSGFPPAGSPSGQPGGGPVWRQDGWWPSRAAFSLDFFGGRTMRGGKSFSGVEGLSTLRSSTHLLADEHGLHRSFAANELAVVPGVGAYIGRQVASLAANGHNLALGNWSNVSSATALDLGNAALGVFRRVAVASGGNVNGRRIQNISATGGTPVSIVAFYETGTSGRVRLRMGTSNGQSVLRGQVGALSVLDEGAGVLTNISTVNLGANIWRTTLVWTPAETGTGNIGIGPDSATNGETVIALGLEAQANAFPTPFIGVGMPAPTRLASDVRATEMGWFTDAGLAEGFSFLFDAEISHPANGTTRNLFNIGNGSGDRHVLYIDSSSGNLLLSAVVGGSALSTGNRLNVGAPGLGRLVVAGRCANGSRYLRRKGAAAAVSVATGVMPANPALLYLGQSNAISGFFDDTIRQFHICRPMSDTELDAWVNAA